MNDYEHVRHIDAVSPDMARQFEALCGSHGSIPIMSTSQEQLREEVRFRILGLLDENPDMSQRELARAVGVSLGKLNYVLNALAEKGLIKLGNFTASNDKRRYAYILTPRGLTEKAALTRRFLKRKKAEYEALRAEIEALESKVASAPADASTEKSAGKA